MCECFIMRRREKVSDRPCVICGTPLLVRQKKCCSVPCQRRFYVAENHHGFKGGTVRTDGYRARCIKGRVMPEHRYVMELHLGRKLLPTEVVHHKDGDVANNVIDNLELISSQAEHMAEHRKSFASETHRECTICHAIKPRSAFYRMSGRKGKETHVPHCKECTLARKRQEYAARVAIYGTNPDAPRRRARQLAALSSEPRTLPLQLQSRADSDPRNS
jgi:hypothetical protein